MSSFLRHVDYLSVIKRAYKARCITNSCTTTEVSKVVTSCLTAIKTREIRYCEKVYVRSVVIYFGQLKILLRYLVNQSQEDLARPYIIFLCYIQLCIII